METKLKNYPLGIYTFKDIVEGGYFYVDKTGYVYDIANKYRYVFLSRPRRFGKSLLVDTLTALKAYIAGIPYYYENKTEPAFQTIMYLVLSLMGQYIKVGVNFTTESRTIESWKAVDFPSLPNGL